MFARVPASSANLGPGFDTLAVALPLYVEVLTQFYRRTGLPVLVNTSFNVHEEPIIDTPEQALTALIDGRIDRILTKDALYRRDLTLR